MSDNDRDNIRAFNLRLTSNLARSAFNQLQHSFSHKLDLDSLYMSNRRLAILAGVTPLLINMCISSCIAYMRQYKNLTHCPYCKEPRKANSKPWHQFLYLPLIPRLQGFFRNPETVQLLAYHHTYKPSEDEIDDVFDGDLYRELCNTYVVVDGVQRSYKFFSGKHGIALGVGMDGYLIFGKRARWRAICNTYNRQAIQFSRQDQNTHQVHHVPWDYTWPKSPEGRRIVSGTF